MSAMNRLVKDFGWPRIIIFIFLILLFIVGSFVGISPRASLGDVLSWEAPGISGLLLAALIGMPISVLLGCFGGVVLNRAKGREMITSMMLGLFISGVYQFFLLYVCGTVIPNSSTMTVRSQGYGIRNALALKGVEHAFDNILKVKLGTISVPIGTLHTYNAWIRPRCWWAAHRSAARTFGTRYWVPRCFT